MRSTSPPWSRSALLLVMLAGAAACGCGSAFATTTYRLELSGQIDHQRSCWEDPNFCNPDLPPVKDEIIPWRGYVDLIVAPAGDGTFADPDLLSVDFVSNWAAFAVPGPNPPPEPDRLWPFFGSVTIVDGKVTSFNGSEYDFSASPPEQNVGFTGLTAYFHEPAGHHTGPTDGLATLLMVPEPSTWLLLLAGFALLSMRRGGSLSGSMRTRL